MRRVPVKTLDLRDNHISCIGCDELSRVLELDKDVQHLILCSNRILILILILIFTLIFTLISFSAQTELAQKGQSR